MDYHLIISFPNQRLMHGLPELSETSTLSQREQEILNDKTVSAGARSQSSTANSPTWFPSQCLMRKVASRCHLCPCVTEPGGNFRTAASKKTASTTSPSLKTAAPPRDQNEASKRRMGKLFCHQDMRDDISTFLVDSRGFHRISTSSRQNCGDTLQPRLYPDYRPKNILSLYWIRNWRSHPIQSIFVNGWRGPTSK